MQPKQKPKTEAGPKPRVKKVLPKPKAAPEPPKLPPEGPAVREAPAPPPAAEVTAPAVDVKEELEEIEEKMVAAAVRESRDSPPPSPEKTFEQMQADYDLLPDLEEYTPEMEKHELQPGTHMMLFNFLKHKNFNRTRGIIVKREQDDGEDEVRGYRYHIKLHGASSGFELRWVKRVNTVVIPQAPGPKPTPPPRSPTPSGGSSRETCADWDPPRSSASGAASSSATAPATSSASTGPAPC